MKKGFKILIILSIAALLFWPEASFAGAPINLWTYRNKTYGYGYGGSFLLNGDIDGDGIKDFIISTARLNTATGIVEIYFGGSSLSASADITIAGELANNRFGDGMAIGDFNGDHIDDLAAGATRYGDPDHKGRAYVFYGRSRANWALVNNASQANIIITGASASHFGNKLALGDIDGDGYDDLLVGAEEHAGYGANVLYGKSDASININWNQMDVNFVDNFGGGITSLGEDVEIADVSGDSHKDLLICVGDWLGGGADHTGFMIFLGSGTRLSGNINGTTANTLVWGHTNYKSLGYALKAGDVNNDGKDDVIAGVDKLFTSEYGKLVIFYGGTDFLGTYECATDADVIIRGEILGDLFSMASATGDINNDGIDDIVTTAYYYTTSSGPGRLYVFFGGSNFGSKTLASQADYIVNSPSGYGNMGWWSSVGDINNDGWDEFVGIGRVSAAGDARAWIFSLSHVPPAVTISGPTINYVNNRAEVRFAGNATDPDGGNIRRVQYSLDGGSWQSALPSDGSFSSPSEDYYFDMTITTNGTHSVRVRATDTENATTLEANYATASFIIIGILPETGGLNIYNLCDFWLK